MNINIKLLTENAKIPTYSTDGSGCFDIYATSSGVVNEYLDCTFYTGLSFEVPKGHVLLIFSRSGHGFNSGVRLSNCVGVIDSDYRGELLVKLTGDKVFHGLDIDPGDRVAQGMIFPIPTVKFNVVEELSSTDRGEKGFGSTGV